MIEKIGPTIYKGESIYNTGSEGGGGGGGGGELPEEYIEGSCVDNPNGLGNTLGLITINIPLIYSQDFIEVNIFSTHGEAGTGVLFVDKATSDTLFNFYSKYNYDPGVMLASIEGYGMSPRYWRNNLPRSYKTTYRINVPYANVNGVSDGTSISGRECKQIRIFWSPSNFKGGVGRIEVWDSSHITQKVCLIPAKNKNTGNVGFYDKVNNQFFYSTLTDTLELVQ